MVRRLLPLLVLMTLMLASVGIASAENGSHDPTGSSYSCRASW